MELLVSLVSGLVIYFARGVILAICDFLSGDIFKKKKLKSKDE